jgi:hypothetical protein
MNALPPNMRETFAHACREYRGEPPLAKPDPGWLRARLLDELGPIPAEALAAFVCIDLGDDDEAHERMARVVALVREAAKLFNALRRAETEASP